MKIIVDTREQLPLEFNHHYISEVIRKKLECGDYGCEYEDKSICPVYFERKSINDLFSTLSTGYKRFKKEILRAKTQHIVLLIIIEGTMSRILQGIDESQRSGNELLQQLFTLMLRYKIPFICCKNREEMTRWITEFYLAYGREYINNKKGTK
jgi:ERCC4-type nuclease